MTILRPTDGHASLGDGDELGPATLADLADGSAVPDSIREERLAAQIELFERAGYRIEQRGELRAVMVREHRRTVRSRLGEAIRTLGVVPVLVGAPRAYHRVLVTIDRDGAVRLV